MRRYGCEAIVNDLCKLRTTLAFHFFWRGYLAVVAGANLEFFLLEIVVGELLGLFTGLNTDSFYLKKIHIKRA
jgi:hypothetical protein